MSLDKSWDEKGENINQLDDFDALGDYYIQGASDFQKRVIENILTYKNGFKEKEITYKAISNILQIIKNLKAE